MSLRSGCGSESVSRTVTTTKADRTAVTSPTALLDLGDQSGSRDLVAVSS